MLMTQRTCVMTNFDRPSEMVPSVSRIFPSMLTVQFQHFDLFIILCLSYGKAYSLFNMTMHICEIGCTYVPSIRTEPDNLTMLH